MVEQIHSALCFGSESWSWSGAILERMGDTDLFFFCPEKFAENQSKDGHTSQTSCEPPHNEHPQSLRQKIGWGRRAPECLAFPRETEQKPAHWHKRSWLWPTAEGMTASRQTTLARTTNLALPCSPDSSGYARSFLRRALSRAAPSSPAHRVPSRRRGETSVVSKATCAPWNSDPSVTTSRRRASTRSIGNKSKSLTMTFVVTLAPASRHTRAAALSKANPRRPKTPASAQPARWWPRTSRRRPHRQEREEGGRGSQRRRRSSTRKAEESKRDNGEVGKQVNGTLDSVLLEI